MEGQIIPQRIPEMEGRRVVDNDMGRVDGKEVVQIAVEGTTMSGELGGGGGEDARKDGFHADVDVVLGQAGGLGWGGGWG